MALSIQDLVDDLFFEIFSYLSPQDILCLRRTCKQVHNLTFSHKIWLDQLRSICETDSALPTTTYNLPTLSALHLEHVVLHPLRFMHFLAKPPAPSKNSVTHPDPHSYNTVPLSDPKTKAFLSALQLMHGGPQIDRSGRFIVTTVPSNDGSSHWSIDSLCLWDLGAAETARGVRRIACLNIKAECPKFVASGFYLLRVFTRVLPVEVAGDRDSDWEVVVILFADKDDSQSSTCAEYQLWSTRVPPPANAVDPSAEPIYPTPNTADPESEFRLLKGLQLLSSRFIGIPHIALDKENTYIVSADDNHGILLWDWTRNEAVSWRWGNPIEPDFCRQLYVDGPNVYMMTFKGEFFNWTFHRPNPASSSPSAVSSRVVLRPLSKAAPIPAASDDASSANSKPATVFALRITEDAAWAPAPTFALETRRRCYSEALIDLNGQHGLQRYLGFLEISLGEEQYSMACPKRCRVTVFSVPLNHDGIRGGVPGAGSTPIPILDFYCTTPPGNTHTELRFVGDNIILTKAGWDGEELEYMVVPRFDSIKIPFGYDFLKPRPSMLDPGVGLHEDGSNDGKEEYSEVHGLVRDVYWRRPFVSALDDCRVHGHGRGSSEEEEDSCLRFYHDGSGVYMVSPSSARATTAAFPVSNSLTESASPRLFGQRWRIR